MSIPFAPGAAIDSFGSVTPGPPGASGPSNGPSWFACEHPERTPDVHAVWHAHGCGACLDLVGRWEAARPSGDPAVTWVAHRVLG